MGSPPFRQVLRCAAPGLVLLAVCLLPFLNKAFTIDDPYFLFEARQSLKTPLAPTSVAICWENMGYKRTLRQIGSNGVLSGYLLAPVILLGSREWIGHLWILLFAMAAVTGTVALAFRCGADRSQATLAGLIFASTPVVLAMAGTLMPDIPATALAVFGMERILAWKQERRIGQAIAAGLALGLAPLARSHTIFLLPIAALILTEPRSLGSGGLRRIDWVRFLPLTISVFCFVFVTWITFDRSGDAVFAAAPNTDQIDLHHLAKNLQQFGTNWLLATAVPVAWIVMSGRRSILLAGAILAAGGMLTWAAGIHQAMRDSLGLAGMIALCSILIWTWRSGRTILFWLAVWLFIPLPIALYIHMPPKYLVPCIPAAAILVGSGSPKRESLPGCRRPFGRLLAATIILAGTIFGVLILEADAEFAAFARQVTAETVAPQVAAGGHAWYAGDWALLWYAEKSGANCLTNVAPFPQPGDLLVAGEIEGGLNYVNSLGLHTRLLRTITREGAGGRIMNVGAEAGFYSNGHGYLPWAWSSEPLNTYYVWEIE